MTPTDGLLVALVFLLLGVVGAVRSVRTGRWEQGGWRVLWVGWITVAGALVLYASFLVSNITPGG